MKFVPGCDDFLITLGVYMFSAVLLQLTRYVDEEVGSCESSVLWKLWGSFSTIVAVEMFFISCDNSIKSKFCLLIMAVYLVVCSVMDVLLYRVNDFMQFLGLAAGFVWVMLTVGSNQKTGVSLILFAVIQYILFMRMYGAADGMAFMICSLFMAGLGKGMDEYLLHMLLSFVLVAVVQLLKRNVNRKGKLKQAIALYPYITISFWWMLFPFR